MTIIDLHSSVSGEVLPLLPWLDDHLKARQSKSNPGKAVIHAVSP